MGNSEIKVLNIPTGEPETDNPIYAIDNGPAGNGNAILDLMASVGIQPQAPAAAGGGKRKWRNGGQVKQFLASPITPGQIILYTLIIIGTVVAVTWIAKKL